MNLHWKNKTIRSTSFKPKKDKVREFHQLEKFLSTCDNAGIREMVINRMEDLVRAI